jgi:6-phosphofructokinase
MTLALQRVAVSLGEGYVSGLNAVIGGVVLAANELGCAAVGIHDGFDGLLEPARYRDGGVVPLSRDSVERLFGAPNAILGTACTDPFHVRRVDADNVVGEVDRSRELIDALQAARIDAVISVVGARGLTIAFKLAQLGVTMVCVPMSVENHVGMTSLSFGFNTALSFVTDALESAREGARSMRRHLVVEVMGKHSGWLALQAGTAVMADAILIPEISYDVAFVAERLRSNTAVQGALVIVAEGASPIEMRDGDRRHWSREREPGLQPSLCPDADPQYGEGQRIIDRSGAAAATVARALERLTSHKTESLVLGPMALGGAPTAADRQLGLSYGAAALRALAEGKSGVMVAFDPPHLRFVPLAKAVNQYRTVPPTSDYLRVARALGICLGARGRS